MRSPLLFLALVATMATARAQAAPDSASAPPSDTVNTVTGHAMDPVDGTNEVVINEPARGSRSYTHAPATAQPLSYDPTNIEQKGHRSFSIARLFDPDGSNHWRQMNSKSARKSADSPPGTVPVFR